MEQPVSRDHGEAQCRNGQRQSPHAQGWDPHEDHDPCAHGTAEQEQRDDRPPVAGEVGGDVGTEPDDGEMAEADLAAPTEQHR